MRMTRAWATARRSPRDARSAPCRDWASSARSCAPIERKGGGSLSAGGAGGARRRPVPRNRNAGDCWWAAGATKAGGGLAPSPPPRDPAHLRRRQLRAQLLGGLEVARGARLGRAELRCRRAAARLGLARALRGLEGVPVGRAQARPHVRHGGGELMLQRGRLGAEGGSGRVSGDQARGLHEFFEGRCFRDWHASPRSYRPSIPVCGTLLVHVGIPKPPNNPASLL